MKKKLLFAATFVAAIFPSFLEAQDSVNTVTFSDHRGFASPQNEAKGMMAEKPSSQPAIETLPISSLIPNGSSSANEGSIETVTVQELNQLIEDEVGAEVPDINIGLLRTDALRASASTIGRRYSAEELLSLELDRLNKQPARKIEIPGAPVRDVIHFLADAARINYLGLPDEGPVMETNITTFMNDRPFSALTRLCDTYGIGYQFSGGNWHFYPVDNNDLIAATYKLKYNNQESVTGSTSSLNSSLENGVGTATTTTTDTNSNGTNNTSSGFGGGGGGSFEIESDELVEKIESLLELTPSSNSILYQATGSVDGFEDIPIFQPTASSMLRSEETPETNGSVIYNSDTSSLFVIATRFHHEIIRNYIGQIDRPLPQVHIDTKLIESQRDPSKQFGFDWNFEFGIDSTDVTVDLSNIGGNPLANTALISATDLELTLTAIEADGNSSTTSQPRLTTVSNRPVSLRSIVNQPVSSGTTEIGGTSTSTTSTLNFVEIGTSVNILPRVIEDGEEVALNVVITVSGITGFETINGNRTPITSERVFNFEVKVPDGYTLAVGGLESLVASQERSGVPYISRIPFLGKMFRTDTETMVSSNLMLMITPTIIPADSAPESLADFPTRREDISIPGALWRNTGTESVADCFDKLEAVQAELDRISPRVREFRSTTTTVHQLERVRTVLSQIEGRLLELAVEYKDKPAEMRRFDNILAFEDDLSDRANRMLNIAFKSPNAREFSL